MVAVLKLNTCLALLAVDLRVDLDLTDKEGRSLEERAPRYFAVLFCIFKIRVLNIIKALRSRLRTLHAV